jgi:glucose/arabinose dehydrogenase
MMIAAAPRLSFVMSFVVESFLGRPMINRVLLTASISLAFPALAQVRSGKAAMGDWRQDAPGVVRHIGPDDLPPRPTAAKAELAALSPRPSGAAPKVPAGFGVTAFATLDGPRQIRTAPNGDIFAAETDAGRVRVLRAAAGADTAASVATFAEGLDRPFGIAFFPAGPHPRWVYVAENNRVLRYAYASGDLKASGPAQTVVAKITPTSGMHSTRDLAFSADGKTLFVSVGSGSNAAESMSVKSPDAIKAWEAAHAVGAAWDRDTDRADVLAFDPDGGGRRVFADGLRNCVSMAVQPRTGALWCAVNERDGLGDDLPPDYVTRVRPGGYYGWPWYYIGRHEDPHHKGERPDLAGKVVVPDVLIQAHSAPLGITFYTAEGGPAAFPAGYRGDAFVTLHGSWNRARRTGYKLVRVTMRDGAPTGDYQDFMTGFVVDDHGVWGRPVGVTVAADGALLVSDDASGTIWRIAPANGKGHRR